MIAPPEYKAELITLKKNEGIEILQKVLKIVEEEIKKRGGIFKLVTPPIRIGNNRDEIDSD
jgi:translation initiation factor 2 alpha subunit (eIF-2alpha)